jgi:hypothetical protein
MMKINKRKQVDHRVVLVSYCPEGLPFVRTSRQQKTTGSRRSLSLIYPLVIQKLLESCLCATDLDRASDADMSACSVGRFLDFGTVSLRLTTFSLLLVNFKKNVSRREDKLSKKTNIIGLHCFKSDESM